MASGDAQKVWFPELIEMVRQAGAPAMSMDALLRLRDRLDTALQTIRRTRQIVPAMMWCSHCQARHCAAPPSVSVRATILALGRFTRVTASEVQALEKQWNSYRRPPHSLYEAPKSLLFRRGSELDFIHFPRTEKPCAIST